MKFSAILPPAVPLFQETGFAQIVQRSVNRGAGELQLSRDSPDRRPADSILVGTILEIHVHRPRAMGQIRRINRIEVSHSSVSRAHGRRISLCRTGGWSWSGSWRSLGCGRGNDLHTGRGIFLEDRRLQFSPVCIINLALAMIWRLVLLPEGDAPVQKQP